MEPKQNACFLLPASQQDPCCRDLYMYICMLTDLLRRRVCAVWTKLKLNLCVETVEYIHMEITQIHKAYVVYEDVKALKILATYHQILFPAEPAKTSISNPTSII